MTRADYGNGYTVFGFNLSPDLCPDDGHFNIVRIGNLRRGASADDERRGVGRVRNGAGN